jgi:hypothetical protein
MTATEENTTVPRDERNVQGVQGGTRPSARSARG